MSSTVQGEEVGLGETYGSACSRRRSMPKRKNRRRRMSNFFDEGVPEMALKSLFQKYDKDCDGVLNQYELRELFIDDLGLEEDQAEIYNYILDRDGDNRVSYDEFVYWMRSNENLQNATDKHRFGIIRSAVDLFKKYDKNNNWSLDVNELREMILDHGGSEDKLSDALLSLDEDKNGRISFQEFLKWLDWLPIDELFFEYQ